MLQVKMVKPSPTAPLTNEEKMDKTQQYVALATVTTERLVGCAILLIGFYMLADTARQVSIHIAKSTID